MSYTKFTYGAELEWADVDIRIKPPAELGKWDGKDATLVNSDGHANDPSGKTWNFGGEINTTPTDTIEGQIEIFLKLKELLNPTINYRNSVHIHIGVEGLKEDLEGLKTLFQYTQDNQDTVLNLFPLIEPTKELFPVKEDLKLAQWYRKQRTAWSKGKVPPNRVIDIMNSTSPRNFYDCHFMWIEARKKRVYHIGIVRAGINVRALFKYGTIEFRLFPGTLDPDQLRDMFEFCSQFVYNAFNNPSMTAQDILDSREWNFPIWAPFNPELERGFKATKIKYMEYPDSSRAAVEERERQRQEKKRLEQEKKGN